MAIDFVIVLGFGRLQCFSLVASSRLLISIDSPDISRNKGLGYCIEGMHLAVQ